MLIEIISWLIWGILVWFAVSWAIGCRVYVKSGRGIQWATASQTLFLCIISILFLIFDWNKLHILWIAPISILATGLIMIGKIPILRSLLLFITNLFMKLILIGVKSRQR